MASNDQNQNTEIGAPLDFGPLDRLLGTWQGDRGANLIAVPNPNDAKSFSLEVQPYSETLTFTAVSNVVEIFAQNKAFPLSQNLAALKYEQVISSLDGDQNILHVETGMWLFFDLDPNFNIARQAVIPHGNALLAVGKYAEANNPPTIEDISAFPDLGSKYIAGYTDVYDRTNLVFPADQTMYSTANLSQILRDDLNKVSDQIAKTITLSVSTSQAGGVLDIPFLTENNPTVQNRANATAFNCDYWLEVMNSGAPQLQYLQQSNLEFLERPDGKGLIMWPHINLNTLQKVAPS